MSIRSIFCQILIMNFCLATKVTGQVSILPSPNLLIDGALIKSRLKQLKAGAETTVYKRKSVNKFMLFADTSAKATLIATNKNFHIYKLPLDNMPCLVPNEAIDSKMPTMKEFYNEKNVSAFNNNIPNRLKKQALIPKVRLKAN